MREMREREIERRRGVRRFVESRGIFPRPPLPRVAINARIDFGRWIVDCPYCPGAEYLDMDDPVFFCLSCEMEENGGRYILVSIPENPQAIEKSLLGLPRNRQHWRPQ